MALFLGIHCGETSCLNHPHGNDWGWRQGRGRESGKAEGVKQAVALRAVFLFLLSFFISSHAVSLLFLVHLEQFLRFMVKLSGKYRYPLPLHIHSLPYNQHPSPRGISVTINEPAPTQYYHPKFRVYLRVHSWHCTSSGFGQMCNDMYLPLQYHTD